MSDFSLTLVLRFKTSKKIFNDMAKVSIKSEKITPFGGIFHVRELFSRYVGPVIDKVLGLRCTSYGYQYSEIVGSLSSVYFCGGDCVEDVTSHLIPHLSLHPTLRTCSSDTILRGISELATAHARLWRLLRSTRSCSTYVPTAAAHFTAVCLRCADGSASR